MSRIALRCGWVKLLAGMLLLGAVASLLARGQETVVTDSPGQADKEESASRGGEAQKPRPVADAASSGKRWARHFGEDQRDLWSSPARIRSREARWLLVAGGAAASLLAADRTIMRHNELSPTNMRRSVDFSNYGVGALIGMGGALYLWGKMSGDDHKRETGFLSGEAAVNALAISSALQGVLGRQRPGTNNGDGRFLQGGTSFPSDHAAAAWSIASMIAHQYPGPLTKVFAYGLAGAVSVSRVTGNRHFPSDVFVGSALGWLVARQMYHRHHDPDLGGGTWGSPIANDRGQEGQGAPALASPYVPLDSWVYPNLERLASLGYIHTDFLSARPWTRKECARLLEEADEMIPDEESSNSEARRIYNALAAEFAPELDAGGAERSRGLQVESVYTRLLGISGQPLHDSYHFGQTLINDFGRPYGEGFNPISGFSGWANWGRFALYVRGEYQHSPSAPAYSQAVRDLIGQMDGNLPQPARPIPTTNQFRLLDTYALTKVWNWDISFGKQSLWWGPNEGASLIFSNNAEPIYMFRVARDIPLTLPWLLRGLGPVKAEAFFGKLSGNEFPPRPFMHGEMISFKPTENLELGFSRTAVFGGVGRPLTIGAILNSYFALHPSEHYPESENPGQRNGGFSFSYRVPRLRNWLTVYGTAMSRDDITPLVAFTPLRAAINPGVFLARIPHVRRLDLRVEAVLTDPPAALNHNGNFMYWNHFYQDLYTNKNNLIGAWIGRVGTGYQAWTTYWFNPRTSLQFGYRHAQVASTFLPHGGTVNDGSVKVNWPIGNDLILSAFVQYEKWLMPALASEAKNNVTASLQLTLWPRRWDLRK